MTDNDFADPWGLPPTAESGDEDVDVEAPAEPPPAPEQVGEPRPVAPTPEPADESDTEPEPAPAEEPAEPPAEEPSMAPVDEPSADTVADAHDQVEVITEPVAPKAQEPPPASSGPYSQVLAAASGLFGRSTAATAPEPVEVAEAAEEAASAAGDAAAADVEAAEIPVDEAFDEVGDLDEAAAAIDSIDDAAQEAVDDVIPDMGDVEDALSSLETDIPDVTMDAREEIAPSIDEASETVSVEQIAAMASQLEVETPEPFEVSFTTEDETVEDDTEETLETVADELLGIEVEESEISIDMDSAPAVYDELSEAMDEPSAGTDTEEPVAGGFDVGAVFHSDRDDETAAIEISDEAAVEGAVEEGGGIEDGIEDLVTDDVAASAAFGAVAAPMSVDEAEAAIDDQSEVVEGIDAVASHEVEEAPAATVGPEEVEATAPDETEPADEPPEPPTAEDSAADIAAALVKDEAASEDESPSRFVDSGEVEWGARWHESAQGWVEDTSGQATWRPIVTTAASLSEWEVDTYLGIVVGDSPLSTGAPMDTAMALSRQHAIRLMVDEALSRGAHAVIGVQLGVADVGSIPLATATGTAVTLKPGDG